MEAIEQFLLQIPYFFINNWIASAILAVVVIIAAIKNPGLLFKVICSIVAVVAVLYIMIFLEKSMFSGASSKERAYEVERQSK
jgi:hypothetical protein